MPGYNPTGTVTFSACGPLSSTSGCATGGTAVGTPATLTAGAGATSTASSTTFTPQALGTYCFRADYSGDNNYNASSDGTGDECFTVGPATPAVTSSPTSANVALGAANTDGATIAGNAVAGTPAGTVTFSVCGPLSSATGCATGGTAIGSPVNVTAGANNSATATSPSFTAPSPGTYCFRADYAGTGNYTSGSDGTSTECFTVARATAPTTRMRDGRNHRRQRRERDRRRREHRDRDLDELHAPLPRHLLLPRRLLRRHQLHDLKRRHERRMLHRRLCLHVDLVDAGQRRGCLRGLEHRQRHGHGQRRRGNP